MVYFMKLEDSPMLRTQMKQLEQSSEQLKDRCQSFQKGCKKYMSSLGEAFSGDNAFADALDLFSGRPDDLVGVAIGGPIMSQYVSTFREIGGFKELLQTQVEHMLSDRLMQFINVDLQDVKEARRRFDKATHAYDQAREKVMSLKKSTKPDVITELEEDLHNSRSTFERCRFNLISSLVNIEAKKKSEFLESLSAIMDAHLRYFKQGYDLLSRIEPFIHQVLTYAQQSKEVALSEQDEFARRIQEFRTQTVLENSSVDDGISPTGGDGIHMVGMTSYRSIEAVMQASLKGKVQTIKQGYLLKRSSNIRGDWKRRFFVLDSHGTLYYQKKKLKPVGSNQQSAGASDSGSGMFAKFRSSRPKVVNADEGVGYNTVDLRTSTIKLDAEQTDLRFCFRIISPLKTYTLQAENGADRMDWIDKITGVIASLLTNSFPVQHWSGNLDTKADSFTESSGADSLAQDGYSDGALLANGSKFEEYGGAINSLKEITGNQHCAECSAPEPDWASLNLGMLLCIECSGVHRNLGVHISKVRSLMLDVKVWHPVVVDMFHHLGNTFCNSVWEELLQTTDEREHESSSDITPASKPCSKDPISSKEKYIQSKYVEKKMVKRMTHEVAQNPASLIWEAVKSSNIQTVYRLLVASDVNASTIYDQTTDDLCHQIDVSGTDKETLKKLKDPASCPIISNPDSTESCWQGCSLLHLACHGNELTMVELLLQFGANVNARDFHGRTPLHHCISAQKHQFAKYLMRRGARPSIKDRGGQSSLDRTMEHGPITDEELLILLTND